MIFKDLNLLKVEIEKLKSQWKKIVWTNGCFDLIHPGHIENFRQAKNLWDILIVWLNWDQSPHFKTKPWRPINNEDFRAQMLMAIRFIDFVYIFQDEKPFVPVREILPDIMVKWWDYKVEDIAWAKEVIENWWEVVIIPVIEWYSTTAMIKKIQSLIV